MQNIDVRFNATSNFGKVKADLAALEAQAASLGAVFTQNAYAKTPALVDPASWQKSTRAVHEASNAYRNAVSSSGMLTSQQIRATAESERYTKSLQKQKLALGDMRKHSGIMKQVYDDQLRYQRMTAQYWGTDSAGRAITDITIPKNVPRDLDTVAQKLYFTGQMAKSAGTQIVNMGKNMQWAGRQLMVGFTYPVALFGAAAGVMAFKVDEAMTQVTKVYDVSAEAQKNEALRTKELQDVRTRSYEVATQAASKYGQSIENTLGVEAALAATGLSGDKLFESTDAVSRIATLGDLDLTSSTDMTIALQTAFKDTIKTTDDLTNAFNFMNAVENATSLQIKDIAEMIPRAASAMSALDVSVEQSTVLMTAMKEAGVDAAEGANALKSATGTILAPSPAADEFIKQISNGQVQVTKLAKASGGNLYEAMRLLYEQMSGLSDLQKQQILVKLFGKYQFNRVSAMVTNLGDAFEGTQNQTRKAMDLMGEDVTALGDSADRELGEKMNAVSGKWKAAWQSMRVELSKIGEPFLKVATYAAEVTTKVLKFFNGMSDWKKNAVMIVAAVMAIAGPLVMMGGLFMNLGGQFIKGGGRIMSVMGRVRGAIALVTKEEQAATLAADAQNKAMMQQQNTTSTLAQEINILTAAYEKATMAAKAYAQQTGVLPSTAITRPAPTSYLAPIGPQLPPVTGPVAYSYPRGASADDKTAARASAVRALQMAEVERIRTQENLNKKAASELAIRQKSEKAVTGTSVGMAAMGVGMAAMMLPLGEASNNFGKWLMIGSIVVPAVITLAQVLAAAARSAGAMAASAITTATASNAAALGFGAKMKAGVGGVAAGVAGLMSPVGWLVTGVAAIGAGWWAINNSIKKSREEHARLLAETDKLQTGVLTLTEKWAEATGRAYQNYRLYNQQGSIDANRKEKEAYVDTVRQYQTPNDEGGFKDETDAFNTLPDGEQEYAKMLKMSEFLTNMKMDAKEAKTEMAAFLDATGMGSTEARIESERLFKSFKDGKTDWKQMYAEVSNVMLNGSFIDQPEKLKALGTQAGTFFAQGFAKSNVKDAKESLQFMDFDIMNRWLMAYQKVQDEYVEAQRVAAMMSGKEVTPDMEYDWKKDFEEMHGDLNDFRVNQLTMSADEFKDKYSGWFSSDEDFEVFAGLAAYAGDIERSMIGAAGQILGMDAEVDTLRDFMNEAAVLAKTLKPEEQGSQVSDWLKDIQGLDKKLADSDIVDPEEIKRLEDSRRLLIANLSIMKNFGNIEFTSKADERMFNKLLRDAGLVEKKVKDVKEEIDKVPDTKTITIRAKEIGGVVQSAMSNVQSAMADSAMNEFNSNWDSSMDAAQTTWDNRMDNMTASHDAAQNAMDNAQQNAQDAFDRRWEARKAALEKEYERKIERVNREIEAEQKADQIRQDLFEKEKARLAALAENANTDIDFNTQLNEGNLDEAAKTLNNAGAAGANAQMDAEAKAAEKRTEARIAALEKKNERLEKARDKEVQNLEKLEERMRKHLERVQDARRRALEKQQADEVKALEKSEEASMASMEKQRDYEEAMLQERLELFQSYTARNQKDLERWMREVGLSYDDFGEDVKAKGEDWSKHFRTELAAQIRKAGLEIQNDNMWENVGRGMANKLLKGLGFDNLAQFNRFVRTGSKGKGGKGEGGIGDIETRHEGGMIGMGGGSRGNIPNTYKGLHRSEKMVRAQKGEYVINKNAVKGNLGLLEAINKGADTPIPGMGGITAGDSGGTSVSSNGYGGPAALLAGAISQMFAKGTEKAFNNAYQKGLAKQQAKSGSFSGDAGTYGGRAFSAAQMRNAATIASVGSSMGMSPRDIQIGIMTAIAESGLVNVNHGDRDSLGLFQQRPSMGWGTPAQVTNPEYAARAFFGPLKAHGERNDETPWLAAQHIQRSAFADGSNYRVWWDAAQQIFKSGLSRSGGAGGGYVAGTGGKHRPISYGVSNGLHGGSTSGNPPAVDMAGPSGAPVRAVADGRITSSRDIAGPLSTDTYRGDGPYGSFGRMITMQTDSGAGILYAHLSRRSVSSGQRVKGGSTIGYSGNTGNSSGAHLHFGATNGPYAWLRKGGEIKYDNTHVVAHRGETMLSAPVTKQLKDNIASGGGSDYNVTIDLRGAYIKEDVDIEKAVNTAIDRRETKVGRKRVVR